MTQIVKILSNLKQTQGPHLVLLDELGAGTEPSEGAVLARSILEYLQEQGARTIATTHYSELKTFAYTRNGWKMLLWSLTGNAPTHIPALIGLPGRSNAPANRCSLRFAWKPWSIVPRSCCPAGRARWKGFVPDRR